MDNGKFVLDTNFILDYLQGAAAPARFLAANGSVELWISDITRLELLSFPPLDETEKKRILEFLEYIKILPVTTAVGDIAIVFRRATRRKLPDSLIAATAVHLAAALVTSDRDLLASSFPGLSTIQPQ